MCDQFFAGGFESLFQHQVIGLKPTLQQYTFCWSVHEKDTESLPAPHSCDVFKVKAPPHLRVQKWHFFLYWIVDGFERNTGKRRRFNICHKGPHHKWTGDILITWYASYLTTSKARIFAKILQFYPSNLQCGAPIKRTSLHLLTRHGFKITLKYTQIGI